LAPLNNKLAEPTSRRRSAPRRTPPKLAVRGSTELCWVAPLARSMTIPVFCETAELVAEASRLAESLDLTVAVELASDPLESAARSASSGLLAGALCMHVADPIRAIAALHLCGEGRVVIGAISEREPLASGFAADLGFVCVRDVAPAIAALALLSRGAERPWRASVRKLSSADHARLARHLGHAERNAGRLSSEEQGAIALQLGESGARILLGHGLAVAEALRALRRVAPRVHPPVRFAHPADLSSSRDVLFGPPRMLSDPASKAALLPFDLPMPQEELCSSPSRAAAEAARIGFPVRISLASPDLRLWDHPELSVDGVDNAARVRDVFRQLASAAQELAPNARVLGVTVTATTLARALIRVSAKPAPNARVLLRVGFSDPHGAVAKDAILTPLPASEHAIERALTRLAGEPLLLGEKAPEREKNLALLTQLFARIGSFVDAFRGEIERVELHPVALLVGGGAEVREAAIEVTDAFVRELG
jgi:hypothetical protein